MCVSLFHYHTGSLCFCVCSYLSACLLGWLLACLFVCLFVCLPFCLCVCLPFCALLCVCVLVSAHTFELVMVVSKGSEAALFGASFFGVPVQILSHLGEMTSPFRGSQVAPLDQVHTPQRSKQGYE